MENALSRPARRPFSILRFPLHAAQPPLRGLFRLPPWSPSPSWLRGFTIVELLAVVGIIALLLAISIPGMTRAWEERKVAQAQTIARGLLMTARAQALRTGERGLFFYVDPDSGAQRIAPIVADPPQDLNSAAPGYQEIDYALSAPGGPPTFYTLTDATAVHRFKIDAGDIYTLPVPIRIVPRQMVDVYGSAGGQLPVWPETDIAYDKYDQKNGDTTSEGLYRHRNFFAVVFAPDGQLLIARDVLIHDADALPQRQSGPQGDNRGDRTGLFVEEADKYGHMMVPPPTSTEPNVDPTGAGGVLLDMVVDRVSNQTSTGIAINFCTADGLLVYDESVLADIPEDTLTPDGRGTDGKRGYLIREGIPIYIARQTGEIVEGPKGEGTP